MACRSGLEYLPPPSRRYWRLRQLRSPDRLRGLLALAFLGTHCLGADGAAAEESGVDASLSRGGLSAGADGVLFGDVLLLLNTLYAQPGQSLAGLGIVVLGYPFYWYWSRRLRN